ncbi:unnamed protein product [Allacma fusca]|uniref:O-acyltransferase WSD1 C-terminal domain-containing protein n=1 Tax=Allacma fusca TaxID=39272 RepID=A0A8J2K9W2_9HEXA|nr:unnamed protein product [Allacma fusca]
MVSKRSLLRLGTLTAFTPVVLFISRLLTCIGCVVVGPGLFLSLVPLIFWKFLVTLVCNLVSGGECREPLSFFDTVFAVDNFYTRPHASTLKCFILDGHLSLSDIRELFCNKILYKRISHGSEAKDRWQFQRLHQVPRRFGWFYFWTEVPVNVDLHVKEAILTDDMNKNGCGQKSVVILRVHHVIADGYSLNSIVDEMISKESRYLVKEQEELSLKQKLYFFWTAPAWIVNFFLEEMFAKNPINHRKEDTTGVLAITSIPLEVIKSIRRKTNCHFATIGLSLLGGALRRLFLETRQDINEIPDFLKIMHLLPRPDHPFDRMCNHWSAGSFKVSLKSHNALDRLNEAEEYFRGFTENNYQKLLDLQSTIANLLPAPIYSLVLSRKYLTNMSFTSLPGYDGQAQLCGHDIVDLYKVIGLQYKQTALGAAAYSHNGQLAFSIFANRDILPTQESGERLAQVHLQAELAQLVELLALDAEQV